MRMGLDLNLANRIITALVVWILSTRLWNDTAPWLDTAVWKDS